MKHFFYFLTGLFFLCASHIALATTPIHDVRLAQNQTDVVRLVAETEKQPEFNVFKLNNPPRLVIDFPDAEFTKTVNQKQGLSAAFVNNLRLGNPTPKTCRFVLELPHPNIQESHFLIPPEKGGKWRFVPGTSAVCALRWLAAGNRCHCPHRPGADSADRVGCGLHLPGCAGRKHFSDPGKSAAGGRNGRNGAAHCGAAV